MSEKRNEKRRDGGRVGGPHGMRAVEKPKDFKGSVKGLLKALRPWKWKLRAAALLSALSAAIGIFGPKVLGNATTEIFNGVMRKVQGTGGIDFAAISRVLLALVALFAVSTVLSHVMYRLGAEVSNELGRKMRQDIGSKIHRVPLAYYEKTTVGDVLSRVTNDVDSVVQNINMVFTEVIAGIATVIGVAIMMLTISPLLTLLVVLVVPLSTLIISVIFRKSQKYFRAQQEVLGDISGLVEESYSGQDVVQAFRQEENAIQAFEEKNQKLFDSNWRSQFLSGLMQPIMQVFSNLAYLLVVVLGAAQAAAGLISVGDILAFIQYVRNFTQPLAQMAQVVGQVQTMAAAAERVFEFLSEEEEIEPEHSPLMGPIKGRVCFEDVVFGYDPDKPVIKGFSVCVLPGQTCAIVGETGSGKTTLVKLLMRFYDPQGGRITLDDHDLKEYSRQEARRPFGMVLQDTWLFSGSVMENIRYGRPDATDEEVMQAARHAHADHFIRALPGGYDMEINEEADNISAGQKQLLTIARAVLADKPLLILDEATSNVDTLTEKRIQDAMNFLLEGRTSFVIAHRLSTIKGADLILVMHDGNIDEMGTHDDLMHRGGRYKALYESQFEET
ncbi:MAG: ABC transporter ATP-binding protein [Eubacteriales bacterium]|nr:ABC transporter ATP-binding protein [Eubacteriales bacterium]